MTFITDYADDTFIVVRMDNMKVTTTGTFKYADDARDHAMDLARKNGVVYTVFQSDGSYKWTDK